MLTKKEKYAQGGSVQVRLLQINYEVNKKSRLEMKCDFFLNLNMTQEDYLNWYSQPRPQGAFPWLWIEPTSKAREKRLGDEVLIQL